MTKLGSRQAAVLLACLFMLSYIPACRRDDAPNQTRQQRLDALLQTYDQQFVQLLDTAQAALGKNVLSYSSLSDSVTIPKYMEISGSHYDYGQLVGHMARQYGRAPRRIAAGQNELNDRIIEMYRRVFPPYLEIARGLADVFGIPLSELDFIHLEYEFFLDFWYSLFRYDEFGKLAEAPASASSPVTHCSLFFARVGSDAYVGRNFDDSYEKPQFVEFSKMNGVYKVMANACYVPYHWVMDGINERGLVMGTANLVKPGKYYWTDPYPAVPAVCEHHLFRIALESCATVAEVIALYRSVRPWSHATDHLLVADAQGNSAVIEFNLDREAVFFPAEENFQVMTNIAYQEDLEYMLRECRRFSQATRMAENGVSGFADVETITRAIAASAHGYTSFFDIRKRFMQLYRRSDFFNSYDFILPR